jgi:hypothetical protein
VIESWDGDTASVVERAIANIDQGTDIVSNGSGITEL